MTTLSNSRGFTLTELIVTLVLVAVLAIFIVPRLGGVNAVRERSDYDKVLSTLNYARQAAVARRRYVCLTFASSSITLTFDNTLPESVGIPSCTTALDLGWKEKDCPVTNQTCLKYSSMSPVPTSFRFDPLGRASATVSVTITGLPAITVEAETGYVH